MPAGTGDRSSGTFWLAGGLILLLASAWRYALASALPCVSPDGALYLDYARQFHEQGLDLLRSGTLEQHPLFAGGISLVAGALFAFGAPDRPDTWVRAGQLVAGLSGVGVVLASGLAGGSIARACRLPRRPAILFAMLLAAVLPLHTWHSADVMSDELHVMWLLLGVTAAGWLPTGGGAVAVGVCAGLAFLTRPEGGALLVAAGVAVWMMPNLSLGKRVRNSGILLGCFLLLVGPYWAVSGGWSPKLHKETVEQVAQTSVVSLATLTRVSLEWYEAPLRAGMELLRAGRVLVPMVALIGWLLVLRPRGSWRDPALLTPLLVGVAIFAAAQVLLVRHGYLDPRHLLVPVSLLLVVAAVTLAAVWQSRASAAVMLAMVCLLPLASYSLRVPNGADVSVARLGQWLSDQPRPDRTLLLGGSSERRVAFYGGMRFQHWPENLQDVDERYASLHGHLVGFEATHFAITLGPADDLAPNRAMVGRLRAAYPGLLRELHRVEGDRERVLVLYAVDPMAG